MALNEVPTEIQAEIFSYLSTIEKLRCSLLNKMFHGMILYSKASALFWKVFDADVVKKKHKYAFTNISPEVLIDTHGLFKSSLQHFKNLRELKVGYVIANYSFPNLQKLIVVNRSNHIELPPQNFPKLKHLAIDNGKVKLVDVAKLPLHTLRLCGRIEKDPGVGRIDFPTLLYLEIRNFQKYLPCINAPELVGLKTKTMDLPDDPEAKKYEKLEYVNIVNILDDDLPKEVEDELMREWLGKYILRYDTTGILDPFEVKGNFYVR